MLLRWEQAGYPYPADWGPAWKCEPCDAFIRCYQGTVRPLGSLADAHTRHWRSLAHRALDPLWQCGGQSRSSVYRWLAVELGIPEDQAHICLMGPEQCRQVIAAVEKRDDGDA